MTNPLLYVMLVNAIVVLVTTTYLIYRDARSRGSDSATSWGILSALMIPVALVYLLLRSRIGSRRVVVTFGEQVVGTIWIASASSWVIGGILAPPDPGALGWYILYVFPFGLFAGYLLCGRDGWIYRMRASDD